jgi:hypothetical protein
VEVHVHDGILLIELGQIRFGELNTIIAVHLYYLPCGAWIRAIIVNRQAHRADKPLALVPKSMY